MIVCVYVFVFGDMNGMKPLSGMGSNEINSE